MLTKLRQRHKIETVLCLHGQQDRISDQLIKKRCPVWRFECLKVSDWPTLWAGKEDGCWLILK